MRKAMWMVLKVPIHECQFFGMVYLKFKAELHYPEHLLELDVVGPGRKRKLPDLFAAVDEGLFMCIATKLRV